eukprot:snap_masked-scaffold_11-processed-gene-8.34-mRNA-1 protein AED:1.00 eAED:1.00 QI:0/0/0/0/1/1/2/0/137
MDNENLSDLEAQNRRRSDTIQTPERLDSLNISASDTVLTALEASFMIGVPAHANDSSMTDLGMAEEANESYIEDRRREIQEEREAAAASSEHIVFDGDSAYSEGVEETGNPVDKLKVLLWVLVVIFTGVIIGQIIFL